jgi:hypothetical protein
LTGAISDGGRRQFQIDDYHNAAIIRGSSADGERLFITLHRTAMENKSPVLPTIEEWEIGERRCRVVAAPDTNLSDLAVSRLRCLSRRRRRIPESH